MLPIFIRDCTPALNSLMKTPSAVCICEPRCHEDELGSPCRPLRSTDEDLPLSKGPDAGDHVSPESPSGSPAPPSRGDIKTLRHVCGLFGILFQLVGSGFFLLGLFSG